MLPSTNATRNRNRWMLVGIFVLFFGGVALAGMLRFSGWRPEGLKNKGELLNPPADLREVTPTLADGGAYRWNDAERTWRILAMTDRCDTTNAAACERLLTDLDKVWQLSGKDADRVHVLWVGALPAKGPRPRDAARAAPHRCVARRPAAFARRQGHAGLRARSERLRRSALRSRLRSRGRADRPVPPAQGELRWRPTPRPLSATASTAISIAWRGLPSCSRSA